MTIVFIEYQTPFGTRFQKSYAFDSEVEAADFAEHATEFASTSFTDPDVLTYDAARKQHDQLVGDGVSA